MFMPPSCESCQSENVCWLVPPESPCSRPLYRSSFAAKVRCDTWAQKEGCCKTIGPPPKVLFNCPAHFLKKHSRSVPVFFKPNELRVTKSKRDTDYQARVSDNSLPPIQEEPSSHRAKNRRSKQDTPCCYPRPPSRMGLFRHPREKTYEAKYKLHLPPDCECDDPDQVMWQDLIENSESPGENAKRKGRHPSDGVDQGETKDYIRWNAINAVRMPPRRLQRCYLNRCGIHVIDMSDSPFVLRPGYGKVPPYIYRRKWELLQQEFHAKQEMQRQAMQDYQPLADLEREVVISGLKEYWGRLLQEYNALPLSITGDTNNGHRELRKNLEERMKEVEADLKLLTSSSMLFVGNVPASQYL